MREWPSIVPGAPEDFHMRRGPGSLSSTGDFGILGLPHQGKTSMDYSIRWNPVRAADVPVNFYPFGYDVRG